MKFKTKRLIGTLVEALKLPTLTEQPKTQQARSLPSRDVESEALVTGQILLSTNRHCARCLTYKDEPDTAPAFKRSDCL